MLGNDGLAGSIILEKRNVPLPGNAWSFGLDRNPNRFRMDHGVPPTRITSFGRASGVRRDASMNFVSWTSMGVAAEWINRLRALLCLWSEQKKKKRKKCMHPFIRAFVTDPSGGFVTSVNRDGFLTASMIYDPRRIHKICRAYFCSEIVCINHNSVRVFRLHIVSSTFFSVLSCRFATFVF